MKSLRLLLSLVLCISAAAFASGPLETDVGTSATQLTVPTGAAAVLITNNGSTDIWCAPTDSTKAAVGKGQRLQAHGGGWMLPTSGGSLTVYCVASVAQTIGKGTIALGLASAAGAVTEALFPQGFVMSPKAPTKLTAAAPGEVHTTFSRVGVCIRFSCTVSFAYLTGSSSAPPVATTDSNQLGATTVEKFCLSQSASEDYLSLYLSAAGSCYVSEMNAP